VDLTWRAGKLTRAVLRSALGHPCNLRLGDRMARFETRPGEVLALDGGLGRTSPPASAGGLEHGN
jgi:hypothetical protein